MTNLNKKTRLILTLTCACSIYFLQRAYSDNEKQITTSIVEVTTSYDIYPPASQILKNTRDSFPQNKIQMTGILEAKSHEGTVEQTRNIDVILEGGTNPHALYTITDNFGDFPQIIEVKHPQHNASSQCTFSTGHPPKEISIQNITNCLTGFDFSWIDLSLDFLWWTNANTIGQEKLKGRLCYIIDLVAPSHATNIYSKVTLWIDPEFNAFLKAEGYDNSGKIIRRMQVKSFKKSGNYWTVQDLDMHNLDTMHKSTLRVRDVNEQSLRTNH